MPVPWRRYLSIYARKGLPFEDGSSCCFLIPRSDKEVIGLTANAWYLESQVDSGDLPEINVDHLDNKYDVDSLNGGTKSAVKHHLRHGMLKCIGDLKALHKVPRFVWANPLYDGNENRWGVITVDTAIENSPLSKHPNIKNELVEFSKELETLLLSFE